MKRIFISHAGEDSVAASQLQEDLSNAGHDAIVDTKVLFLGDDSIDFMNTSIAEADAVIILYSKHTPSAKWQGAEMKGAFWNEIEQNGGKCIVLRLDNTQLPPLFGAKVFGGLNPLREEVCKKTIEDIGRSLLSSTTATFVVNQALSADSPNPFRRIRAEYFEERSDLLSKAFATPEGSKTGLLEEMTPCFLEGSRGTGKTMLLLSLRARIFIPRHNHAQNPLRIFGFYLKLTRGALCNVGVQRPAGTELDAPEILKGFQAEQVSDISAQELVIYIIESLFSELQHCIEHNFIACDPTHEREVVGKVVSYLFDRENEAPQNILELLELLAKKHRQIAEFIRRKFIYSDSPTVPVATLDFDAFKHVIQLVRVSVPVLAPSMFVLLLDEYENLFPYQQRVVNTFVKTAAPTLSIKIAKKIATADISATTMGQDLQEPHDYSRIPLVYDVEDPTAFKAYRDLLEHIVKNILVSEGLPAIPVSQLLPEFSELEVSESDILTRVAEFYKITKAKLTELPEHEKREKITYYREASVYRALYSHKGRQQQKRFAGFRELALLSSGVIRFFQEMLAVGYYLSNSERKLERGAIVIPAENQTKAAHFVSTHNVTTLSRNIETDGETLKYFLFDLGDCLRQKLLKHGSEPEAGRLTIIDPELLDESAFATLKRMLIVGTREGVFQTKEGRPAFKPRHSSDPQPSEFNICRMYAPVLQISPRLRWRTVVSCSELQQLLQPRYRAKAKKALMKSFEGISPRAKQTHLL
ncbi:MAG: toll/interleukin-1 receptor domain-containing protein [Acidobacteriota bacterium]|nr:toll/interleukin-1 receptor domain-containing protein [Acidobacteriota bacterium]